MLVVTFPVAVLRRTDRFVANNHVIVEALRRRRFVSCQKPVSQPFTIFKTSSRQRAKGVLLRVWCRRCFHRRSFEDWVARPDSLLAGPPQQSKHTARGQGRKSRSHTTSVGHGLASRTGLGAQSRRSSCGRDCIGQGVCPAVGNSPPCHES